ncbi:MAG: hypothetical protein HYZ53_20365 [Planctomycetes bacterium]|nr:hypothetical protein [Planctomycetota bacterium]
MKFWCAAAALSCAAAMLLLSGLPVRGQDTPPADPGNPGNQQKEPDKEKIEGNAKALKARDNLENARTIAKKWKEDAILILVMGVSVKEDGTIDVTDAESGAYWGYWFFSPGTKTDAADDSAARFCVRLVGGAVEQLPGDSTFGDKVALPNDFLDSDKVWAAAKRVDAKAEGDAMMSLIHHEESKDHPFQWDFQRPGMTVSFDAKSGTPLGQ